MTEMNRSGNELLALFGIAATVIFGAVISRFIDLSHVASIIALLMVLWIVLGKRLGGWRAVMVGLGSLIAAFLAALGSYGLTVLFAVLAIGILFYRVNTEHAREIRS